MKTNTAKKNQRGRLPAASATTITLRDPLRCSPTHLGALYPPRPIRHSLTTSSQHSPSSRSSAFRCAISAACLCLSLLREREVCVLDRGSKVGRCGTKICCEAREWYSGEVETVPLGRTMGLCWMASGVEKARDMRRLEVEEMLMASASESGGGTEVCWMRTRMMPRRLVVGCQPCCCRFARLVLGWCCSVWPSVLL